MISEVVADALGVGTQSSERVCLIAKERRHGLVRVSQRLVYLDVKCFQKIISTFYDIYFEVK